MKNDNAVGNNLEIALRILLDGIQITVIVLLIVLITGFSAKGQDVSVINIEELYKLARNNYPLTKQGDLIAKAAKLTVSNAAKGYLPVLSMNGQATYQSGVTSFPFSIPIPGFNIPKYSKDQYKAYFEGDQLLYDGGMIKNQQQIAKTTEAVQQQSLEVELYQLYSRVNELFFGILLIDEQLKQNKLFLNDIHNGIDKTRALIANGIAYRSSIDELEAQFLQTQQDSISLMANRKAYVAMLSLFIKRPLNDKTIFERPTEPLLENTIKRPELLLFNDQKKINEDQHRLLNLQLLPKLGLFAQGGYGRPGLNMLNNNFSWYYLGGIKLSWNFGTLYTHKNQLALLKIGNQTIDYQRETFLLNTHIVQTQQMEEINRYRELLETDDQIIALRLSVKNAADAKLNNGVLNAHDYVTVLNAEHEARQHRVLHESLLLQALYNYKNTTGDLKN